MMLLVPPPAVRAVSGVLCISVKKKSRDLTRHRSFARQPDAAPASPAMPPSPRGAGTDAFDGSATLNAFAAAASGGIVLVALFPVDSVKTHMQVHIKMSEGAVGAMSFRPQPSHLLCPGER